SRFFISQQYADLLGHEPDQPTVDRLLAQLNACNSRSDCLRARRVEISTNLLVENELPATGVFLYGLYATAFARLPRFPELEMDRAVTMSQKGELEAVRMALANAFVDRAEFKQKFPATMKPAEFVDSLVATLAQSTGVDFSSDRTLLISLLDDAVNGRAM